MKFHALLAAAMTLAATTATGAAAQDVAAPQSGPAVAAIDAVTAHAPDGADANGCELHVWPAERMNSMTTGLLGGGLLDAALHANRDASNKTLLASALDSPSQTDALLSLDLRDLLKLDAGTTIVTHSLPLDRHTMNKIKTRRADSQAGCYSELIVADVSYQKAAIYGRSLKTLFMVRKFTGDKISFEYKSWGGNGLKLFPPKEGEDALAALDELVTKFKDNFVEFAANERSAVSGK